VTGRLWQEGVDYSRPPKPETVFVDLVDGVEGPSLSIGDAKGGFRIAGPKPWGGGTIVRRFTVRIEDLQEALRQYSDWAATTSSQEA
jgi:hypothetical protein